MVDLIGAYRHLSVQKAAPFTDKQIRLGRGLRLAGGYCHREHAATQ